MMLTLASRTLIKESPMETSTSSTILVTEMTLLFITTPQEQSEVLGQKF